MSAKIPSSRISDVAPKKPENIVIEWMETTADFYINYTKITTYLRELSIAGGSTRVTNTYAGYCPIDQMVTLSNTMAIELKLLLLDMNQMNVSDLSEIGKGYNKLSKHTLVLKDLNQQAMTTLLLATTDMTSYTIKMADRLN